MIKDALFKLGFIQSDTNNERYINFEHNIVIQIDKKCDNQDKMYVKTINNICIEPDVMQREWDYIPSDIDVFISEVQRLCEECSKLKEQDGWKSGKIVRIEHKIKPSERYTKQTLVIDTDDTSFSKRISIDFVNTYINLLPGLKTGDQVVIQFIVSGKDVGEKNYTTIQAVNLEKIC